MGKTLTVACVAETEYTKGFWTPQRYWPLGKTVVELTGEAEDDPIDSTRIGTKTYACLLECSKEHVSKVVYGNPGETVTMTPKFVLIEGGTKPAPVISAADKAKILEERVAQLELLLSRATEPASKQR